MATKTQLYGDLTLPAAIWSAGAFTHGVVRSSGLHIAATYTQTATPTDVSVGSPILIDWNPTLNDTSAPYGPVSATGLYGPRALINIEGTTQVNKDQSIFAFTPIGFGDMHRVKNQVGANRNIVPGWVILSARTTYADTNTVTIKGNDIADGTASFVDAQTFMTANSGTLDGTSDPYELITMLSNPFLLGHSHVSKRTALKVLDMNQYLGTPGSDITGSFASFVPGADAGIGTVDTQYGLEIPHLNQANVNVGIQNASTTVTPGLSVTVAASITSVSTTVSTSLFNKTAHGLTNGTAVTISGFVTTTGFSATTVYNVINAAANTFQLSAVSGGGAYVPITMGGTNDSTVLTVKYALPISASRLLVTASSALTLTSTPGMAAGLDGQEVEIVNVGANTLTLQDESVLANSGFYISNALYGLVVLAQYESLTVRYSSDAAKWVMVTCSNGGTVALTDGTNGHGRTELTLSANGPALALYTNANTSTDTTVVVALSELTGLVFGPGGTTAPDVSLARSGTGTATYTATSLILNTAVSGTAVDTDSTFATGATTTVAASSAVKTALALKAPLASPTFTGTVSNTGGTVAVTDGTNGHGRTEVLLGVVGGFFRMFTNATGDTQPVVSLSEANGLEFGPGVSTAVDVTLSRTGAAAAAFGGQLTISTGLTMADAKDIVLNATTGTKIGTATTQKVGFLNATPVAQQANTVDLGTVLSNFGFRASGGNPALNLGTGALTAGTTSLGATTFQLPVLIKAASYTVALADAGSFIKQNNGSANTLTIPANATVAFPVGTIIWFGNVGAGTMTLAVTTDTLIGPTSYVTNKGGYVIKYTTTAWMSFLGA